MDVRAISLVAAHCSSMAAAVPVALSEMAVIARPMPWIASTAWRVAL
jgi:hypothetical protein